MNFVPVKSAQRQVDLMVLKVRELLVKQCTQTMNALGGQATEFGVIAAKGTSNVVSLLERIVADPEVPQVARDVLARLGVQIEQLATEIAAIDRSLLSQHNANPVSRAKSRLWLWPTRWLTKQRSTNQQKPDAPSSHNPAAQRNRDHETSETRAAPALLLFFKKEVLVFLRLIPLANAPQSAT